jgi:cysteine desulfuration protein SufE
MPLPAKLQEMVDDFAGMSREEKLETLIAFAESFPPLPERFKDQRDKMELVPECMTPVFLASERTMNGGIAYFADIPPQSPTVRGLASILLTTLNGYTPEDIISVPADFYLPMKLEEAVSGQRLNGFMGVLAHMKHIALTMMEKNDPLQKT